MTATIVDVGALWKTMWTATLAAVVVCIVFSLAVLGATRSLEMRRAGRASARAAYAGLALLGAGGTAAIMVLAITLIARK